MTAHPVGEPSATALGPSVATPPPAATGLRLVRVSPSRAARAPFVVLVLGLLAGGLVALLLLNTAVAEDSFRLHDLQQQGVVLTEREQELRRQVDALEAPAALARRAAALGMGPGGAPVFLRLPDGAVLGTVTTPSPVPKPVTTPPAAKPSAAGSAKPAAKPAVKAAAKPTAKPTAKATPRPTPSPRRTPTAGDQQ